MILNIGTAKEVIILCCPKTYSFYSNLITNVSPRGYIHSSRLSRAHVAQYVASLTASPGVKSSSPSRAT